MKTEDDSLLMRAFDLQKKIEEGEVPVDLNGHCRNTKIVGKPGERDYGPRYILEQLATSLLMLGLRAKPNDTRTLIDLVDGKPIELESRLECSECCERLAIVYDGKTIQAKHPCKYPEGYPIYEWELNVPSGVMVVGNDFRDVFTILGGFDINRTAGCHATSAAYADVGLAHAFVGNTCPGVYQINKKQFVIGTPGKSNPVKGSKSVGGICTDLWWYSIADKDEFLRRHKIKPQNHEAYLEKCKGRIDLVKCEPGVYQFRHLYHRNRNDKGGELFSEINWVRKPDPVKDFLGEFDSLNFTAGQIIARQLEEWPSLYPNNLSGIMGAANQLFCVLGSGIEHHPNGFLGGEADLTADAPAIEIPVFNEQFHWYPLSEYSLIVRAAGIVDKKKGGLFQDEPQTLYLNESFRALAFNVLQCIIRLGVKQWPHDKDGTGEKRTVAFAKKALKAFKKQYPNDIPESCKDL